MTAREYRYFRVEPCGQLLACLVVGDAGYRQPATDNPPSLPELRRAGQQLALGGQDRAAGQEL